MPARVPALISSVLTVLALAVLALLSMLLEMGVLNGTSERQGLTAMGISLTCQGIAVVLLGAFAGWITNRMIAKFNWSRILSVVLAVFLAVLIGGAIALLSILVAIPAAGIS